MVTRMTKSNEEIIKVVVARLSTMPPTVKISIGNQGTFSKEELIKHVLDGDKVGKLVVEMHLNYLREIVN